MTPQSQQRRPVISPNREGFFESRRTSNVSAPRADKKRSNSNGRPQYKRPQREGIINRLNNQEVQKLVFSNSNAVMDSSSTDDPRPSVLTVTRPNKQAIPIQVLDHGERLDDLLCSDTNGQAAMFHKINDSGTSKDSAIDREINSGIGYLDKQNVINDWYKYNTRTTSPSTITAARPILI